MIGSLDQLDHTSILIHCATPRCTTHHPHNFAPNYPIDHSLTDAGWTYGRDKHWYCPGCSTPAATAVRPRTTTPPPAPPAPAAEPEARPKTPPTPNINNAPLNPGRRAPRINYAA